MVSTRGRQSATIHSEAAKATRNGTSAANVITTGSRPQKRRRSTSLNGDRLSPTTKRQNVSISSSRRKAHASAASLPRSTRQQAAPFINEYVQQRVEAAGPSISTRDTFQSLAPHTATQLSYPNSGSAIAGLGDFGGLTNMNYASQGYDEMGTVDTSSFLPQGASIHVKIQSLPVLDNLATQILNILAKSTYQEVINMAVDPESEPGKAFGTVKTLFSHAKKVYSQSEPFLDAYQLGLYENAHIDTIRKANMATFVISIHGSQDVGFYHLNEYFLDTFVADEHQMVKTQAELLLELKTQAYISAASNGERKREEILADLFPHDLEKKLLERRPEAKQLAPSEKDFVKRAHNRRKALLEEPDTEEAFRVLPEKYLWEDFLKDVSAYISKNFETIANGPARKTSKPQRAANQAPKNHRQQAQQAMMSSQAHPYPSSGTSGHGDDFAGKAQRAVQVAMQDYGSSEASQASSNHMVDLTRPNPSVGSSNSQPMAVQSKQPELQFHFENQLHPNVPGPQFPYFHNSPHQHGQMQGQWHPGTPSDPNYVPYPTQSAPTQVLYERARMAATTKSSPSIRKPGHPSQRRPWTLEEENALMAGLDRVKGPHWSQILAMFGPGGTISEVLKDRGQVQLKDKARNLKLFFLKSGIEVPYYLQFVTGELKTRAPALAAKNEAMGKKILEEDRAHVEGVMALASAPQQSGEAFGLRGDSVSQPSDPTARNGLHSNDNVDPSLSASLIASMTGNVAPSADMMTGRTNDPEEQLQQAAQQLQQTPPDFPFSPGVTGEGVRTSS